MVKTPEQKPSFWKPWLSRGRKVLRLLLVAVLVIVLLVVVALTLPGTRGLILGKVLNLVTGSLPGQMTVAEARWPHLGLLEIDGVVWINPTESGPSDTLVVLDQLRLELDLGAIKSRRLGVRSLNLELTSLDIPAITRATAGDSVQSIEPSAQEPSPWPYFAEGSWPLYPDCFVHELTITLDHGLISPQLALDDMDLTGGLDLRPGSLPHAWFSETAFRMTSLAGDTLGLQAEQLGISLQVDPLARSAVLDSLKVLIPEAGNRLQGPVWRAAGGARLDIAGTSSGFIAEGADVAVAGEFEFPGPGHFSGLLPEGFPLDGKDPGQGRFEVKAKLTEKFESMDAAQLRLEMTPTSWLERALVVGQITPQTVQVDTCELSIPGARVSVSGSADNQRTDLECRAQIADGRLIQLFVGESLRKGLATEWPAEGGAQLNLTATADGGIDQGGLVTANGSFQVPGPGNFSGLLPDDFPLDGLDPGQGRFAVTAQVNGGLKSIDSGSVRVAVDSTSWLGGALVVGNFAGPAVQVDTCDISLLGARVLASGAADSSQVDLTCLAELSDGRVLQLFGGEAFQDAQATARLEGHLAGPRKRPDLDLDLQASLQTTELVIPQARVTAQVHGDEVVASVAAAGGVQFGGVFMDSLKTRWDGSRVWDAEALGDYSQTFSVQTWSPTMDLKMNGVAGGDTLRQVRVDSLSLRLLDEVASISEPVHFQYQPEAGSMKLSGFSLALGEGGLDLAGNYSRQGMDLAAAIDLSLDEDVLQQLFPNEIWSRDGGMALELKGQVDLQGSSTGTAFQGEMRAAAIPHRDNPPLVADVDFSLAQGDTSGLKADLKLSAGEISLLRGSAVWPGSANLAEGTWTPDPSAGLLVDIPAQKFALAQLNSFLPPEIGLNGDLDFFVRLAPDSTMAGALGGQIKTEGLKVELPNSSRLDLDVTLELEGAPKDPLVSGQVTINSGFIRIPEIPQNLLPVEGESLLWLAAADSTKDPPVDTLVVRLPEEGPVLDAGGPGFLPDLNLVINLPGKLAIHGYGLNIELEGHVKVTRGYDEEGIPGPAVSGNMGVANGTLKFMNRVFTFISSEVDFQGQVPVNPRLKVTLESEISGYLVRLAVEGTGLDPEIIMTSEPELKEADIMALLIFGQTANDLDSDQRGRMREENDPKQQLQQNMAALAVVMGTSGLSNTMSESLGLDMVELGSDSSGDSTLMVGKYISPRVLVKYNQSLEKSGTYFMTLDYSINKFFKLVSTYGQGEEDSGVEVRWTRRY